MSNFVVGVAVGVLVVGCVWIWITRKRHVPVQSASVHSHIKQLRAIGLLSVYRLRIQEIVTKSDHTWGPFGQKYLQWALSSKKMAMIFEFDVDFVYDLQDARFQIKEIAKSHWHITVPQCKPELSIRNIRFYDEQGAKFLPWLVPDLLNKFLGDGFSEEDKNRLLDGARGYAQDQALEFIKSMQSDVHRSAESTLGSISRAFGAEEIDFTFLGEIPAEIAVTSNDNRDESRNS